MKFSDFVFFVLGNLVAIVMAMGVIGTLYALYKLRQERDEPLSEIFGKSATEGEYTKGNHTPPPKVRWTDRSFRQKRETH